MSPFRFLRPRPALAATALILVAAVSLTTFLPPPAAAQEPEPVDTPTQGICGRTAEVQALLINEIAREIARFGHTRTCEEVTAEDLASITTIFDYSTYLTTLQPGDLDGLTQLQSLRLYLGGEITELPAGLFAETPNLKILSLPRQKIGELPAGIFDDVPKLGVLNLYASELTSLPEEVFEHTPNLRILELADNKLAAVSKDTLDDVPELEILNLLHNRLTELPDNLFDNHTKLRDLDLSANRIAALHEDTFDGLSQLTILNLRGNKLPTLPEDVFEGLSNLTILELQDNPFTSVPVDVFEGLTSLTSLWTNLPNVSPEYFEHVPQLTKLFVIAGSQSIPEDSFHKLTDLERLTLGYGDITSLPADAFDGLSELKWLDLAGNKLTSLDEDIFDGLTSLESLRLLGNELTSLDGDIFEGLTSLETLYLGSNQESTQFSTLPANLFADLAKLKTLSISEAGLDTLPEGAFNGLEAVERIDLTLNNLRSLPAGLFEGITKLNNLGLRQTQISTPVDPPAWAVELGLDPDMFRIRTGDETLVFHVHPELVQGNRIVAKVIEGAPFDISVMLSAEGGTLSANKVTIPAGSIKSPFVTVTPLSADRGMVTVKVTYAIFEGWDTFDDPAGACDCWGFRTGPGDPITVDATFATITGEPRVGETLTADTSYIQDPDGMENAVFSYQWLADDADIEDATDSTYDVSEEDVGKGMKVKVSFTDDADNQETLTSAASAAVTARSNTPATDAPTISGTAQVNETLMADVAGIDDADGLNNVSYSYQWLADDADIQGATASTYTLVADDAGKTIKVQVSFTDDAGNEETRTSGPTNPVAATAPDAPDHLNVSPHDENGLDLYWEAPASHGGSPVTGYKVQWKEAADSWDTPEDVSEETVTGTTHTIHGLTEGVEYAVRVMATNQVGEGPASAEKTAVPRETRAPEVVTSRVDGAALRVVYDETLDEGSAPPADAFDVRVACRCDDMTWLDEDARRAVNLVSVDGDTVMLTLASPATADDYVVVSYTPPSDEASPRVQDAAGNPAAAIRPTQVFNDTEEAKETAEDPPNNPATGAPAISGTAQVGEALTADKSGITDEDGLDNAIFSYQWIAGGTDIDGATGSSYTLTSSEEGQAILVRVSFTDDADNEETRTSAATSAVAPRPPLTVSLVFPVASHHGASNVFAFDIRFSEEFPLSYETLKFHAFSVTGGEVLKAQRMEKPSNIPWRITVRPDSNGDVTVVLPVTTDCDAQGAICTQDGRKLSNSLNFTVSGPGE